MSRESTNTFVENVQIVTDVPSQTLVDLLSVETQCGSAMRASHTRSREGVVVGTVVGIDERGRPLVDFDGNHATSPLSARTTVLFRAEDIGREAVLIFAQGDLAQPILVGLVQPSQPAPDEEKVELNTPLDAVVDGRRIVLSAENEIELRCGKSSITLTRAGKILIRGAYLLSRSSGVNRIKGGSVQIN
jgi:hypothetical protein